MNIYHIYATQLLYRRATNSQWDIDIHYENILLMHPRCANILFENQFHASAVGLKKAWIREIAMIWNERLRSQWETEEEEQNGAGKTRHNFRDIVKRRGATHKFP